MRRSAISSKRIFSVGVYFLLKYPAKDLKPIPSIWMPFPNATSMFFLFGWTYTLSSFLMTPRNTLTSSLAEILLSLTTRFLKYSKMVAMLCSVTWT